MPAEVPALAEEHDAHSVAFTYNDPTVFVEYATDVAVACHERGLATVAVTAGYIAEAARAELYRHLDAANIDLKGFDDAFYRDLSSARLDPVLETIEWAVKHGVWVELTTLVIPGHNDADEQLAAESRWIREHLGRDVPLHLSAFRPSYKMQGVPPTPAATLDQARTIARGEGLRYVYTGNVRDPEGERTSCHGCDEGLIERQWFSVTRNVLTGTDRCPRCGERIPGVFDARARASSKGERYGLL